MDSLSMGLPKRTGFGGLRPVADARGIFNKPNTEKILSPEELVEEIVERYTNFSPVEKDRDEKRKVIEDGLSKFVGIVNSGKIQAGSSLAQILIRRIQNADNTSFRATGSTEVPPLGARLGKDLTGIKYFKKLAFLDCSYWFS